MKFYDGQLKDGPENESRNLQAGIGKLASVTSSRILFLDLKSQSEDKNKLNLDRRYWLSYQLSR